MATIAFGEAAAKMGGFHTIGGGFNHHVQVPQTKIYLFRDYTR